MSKRESIARYQLIVNKVRRTPCTFEDLQSYLAYESELQEYNFVVSKRTFQRDLEDIRSLFGIDIQYNPSRRVYYIDSEDRTEANERILEAFNTFQALNLSDRISEHIHFEKRRPQGTENLYGLLHAIKNCLRIEFTYLKFWEDEPTRRTVEPYALKEFQNRWYVLSSDMSDGRMKTFALDRLSELEITRTRFQRPATFNVNDYFRHSFGIITPYKPTPPKDVVLRFSAFQGKYIKTLPLHASQETLIDNDDELRIKLHLHITHDLIMEILSHGLDVEVIAPESLRKKVREMLRQALGQYGGE